MHEESIFDHSEQHTKFYVFYPDILVKTEPSSNHCVDATGVKERVGELNLKIITLALAEVVMSVIQVRFFLLKKRFVNFELV